MQHQVTGLIGDEQTQASCLGGKPAIDTTELAAKVRHYLKFNEIQWGRFSSLVLGVGQSRLSTLLGKPQPWHMLNRRLQMYYERMQLWMDTRATYGNNPYQRKVKARRTDKKPGRPGRKSGRSGASKKPPRSLFDLEENSGQTIIKLKFNNLKRGNNNNPVAHEGKSEIENSNYVSKKLDVYEGKNDVKVHSIPESRSLVINDDVVVQADPLNFDNMNKKVKADAKLMESEEGTERSNVNEAIPTVKEEMLIDDEIKLEFLDTEIDLFEEIASNKKDSSSVPVLDTADTEKEVKTEVADKMSFFSFLDRKHKEIPKDGEVTEDDFILGN